jgi:hypothetical protein
VRFGHFVAMVLQAHRLLGSGVIQLMIDRVISITKEGCRKMSKRKILDASVLLVGLHVLSALIPPAAAAYIDPVSGSIILQVVAAGILAASFTLKRFWSQVRTSIGSVLSRITRR